jgi:hypothetical protein
LLPFSYFLFVLPPSSFSLTSASFIFSPLLSCFLLFSPYLLSSYAPLSLFFFFSFSFLFLFLPLLLVSSAKMSFLFSSISSILFPHLDCPHLLHQRGRRSNNIFCFEITVLRFLFFYTSRLSPPSCFEPSSFY